MSEEANNKLEEAGLRKLYCVLKKAFDRVNRDLNPIALDDYLDLDSETPLQLIRNATSGANIQIQLKESGNNTQLVGKFEAPTMTASTSQSKTLKTDSGYADAVELLVTIARHCEKSIGVQAGLFNLILQGEIAKLNEQERIEREAREAVQSLGL
jgi:hypothetical protein